MSVSKYASVAAVALCAISAFSFRLAAQPPATTIESPTANLALAKPGTKFEFDIIEMFDAKYLGDTPGYIGKSGGLTGIRPRVALGDPVYRGDQKIGSVTNLLWSRTQDGLTVEFDPEPLVRITVGDPVWLYLNPPDSSPKP